MLKIRLQRFGKKKAPIYRIAVMEKSKRLLSEPVERLGFYNPKTKELVLNKERAEYWQSKGAQPSSTVAALLKRDVDHDLATGHFKFKAKLRKDKEKQFEELKKKSSKIGKAERKRKEREKEEAEAKAAQAAAAAEEAAQAKEAEATEDKPAE